MRGMKDIGISELTRLEMRERRKSNAVRTFGSGIMSRKSYAVRTYGSVIVSRKFNGVRLYWLAIVSRKSNAVRIYKSHIEGFLYHTEGSITALTTLAFV